jgi:hypothetical protein
MAFVQQGRTRGLARSYQTSRERSDTHQAHINELGLLYFKGFVGRDDEFEGLNLKL